MTLRDFIKQFDGVDPNTLLDAEIGKNNSLGWSINFSISSHGPGDPGVLEIVATRVGWN
jgi:hypothetical protein